MERMEDKLPTKNKGNKQKKENSRYQSTYIILNYNSLKVSIESQRLSEWIKNKTNYMLSLRNAL